MFARPFARVCLASLALTVFARSADAEKLSSAQCELALKAIKTVVLPLVEVLTPAFGLAAMKFAAKQNDGGFECGEPVFLVPVLQVDVKAGKDMRLLATKLGVDLEKAGMMFEELSSK